MKNQFLILTFVFILSLTANARAENVDDSSKDNACLTLTLFMKLELKSQRVPFINVSCDIQKNHKSVSNMILDVKPRYNDLDPFTRENLVIMVQAVRGVGDLATRSNWDSKYFKLLISKRGTAEKLEYIFSTDECKTYYNLLDNKGPQKASYFLSQILQDSMSRAEKLKLSQASR